MTHRAALRHAPLTPATSGNRARASGRPSCDVAAVAQQRPETPRARASPPVGSPDSTRGVGGASTRPAALGIVRRWPGFPPRSAEDVLERQNVQSFGGAQVHEVAGTFPPERVPYRSRRRAGRDTGRLMMLPAHRGHVLRDDQLPATEGRRPVRVREDGASDVEGPAGPHAPRPLSIAVRIERAHDRRLARLRESISKFPGEDGIRR